MIKKEHKSSSPTIISIKSTKSYVVLQNGYLHSSRNSITWLLKDLDTSMESSENVVVVEVVLDYINLFPIPTHLYYKMQNITVIILKLYPPLSTETNIHPPIPTE